MCPTDYGTFIWPASISSNPSIGTNGATAPTSSTEIGGIGPDGNLHPVSVTNAGVVNVNLSGSTTTPFPVTDAAAEASLASIDGKLGSLGQKTMAGSAPVVIASDQSAVPVSAASLPLPSGAATAALQTTGNTSLSSIDTKLTSGGQKSQIVDGTTGVSAAVSLTGQLSTQVDPTEVFNESFEGGVIDTTNRWNSPIVAGAGAVTQTSAAGLIVSVGTGAASAAALSSQPTFPTQYASATSWAAGLKVEATPIATGNHRFFGFGTPGSVYSTTNPIANGIGFEITTAGVLRAVVYASDVLIFSSNLTISTDGLEHIYLITARGNFINWFVDNFVVPAAISSNAAIFPDISLLPIRYASLNAGSSTVGTPALTINGTTVLDAGRNATQLADGTYPWRKATISSSGTLSVQDSVLESTVGSKVAGTAATAAVLTGGVYNTALPSLTTGQQAATQLDSSGRQIIVSPGVPIALGQQAAAASLGVTLSNENVQDLYVTGQSAQTATVNNILTAASGSAATDVTGYRSGSVQVVSTGTGGTYIFEGSNDNVNFQTIPVFSQLILTGTATVAAITATATQLIYTFPINSRYVRLRIATTITGGSIQAFSKFSQVSFAPAAQLVSQNTAGSLQTTVTGTVTANQGTAAVVANSWYAKLSDGATGPVKVQAASTAPVAADIALTVALSPNGTTPKAIGRALANAPTVTTYGTPVTSAAYVTIIASTTSATNLVELFDSSGVALFFAVGAAASEVNQFVIYPGGNGQVPLSIPAGSRISYKAVSTSATGSAAFNVLNLYT